MTTRHCLDCASDNSCVNCAECSSLIVQTRCVVIWSHFERERESARWFTHVVCEIMSHRNFSNYFRSYLFKKYELYSIIIISPAPDRVRRCRCMSCQSSHGRHVISMRCFFWDQPFLETADQTSPSDYRPIVIGTRLIGAPLENTQQWCWFMDWHMVCLKAY